MKIPLWFQVCYAIWQFIRSAKLFKLAYGIPYHLVLYWVGKVTFAPFSKIRCGKIKAGKKFNFDVGESVKSKLQNSGGLGGGLVTANFPRGAVGNFGSFHYIFPQSKLHLLGELAYQKPDVLTLSVDYITEGFCIANYDDQQTLLEKALDPNAHIVLEAKRVLLYPSEESTLNQNFVRILSIMPLVFVSRGMPTVSTWFTFGLIILDLFLNALFQSAFSKLQKGLVFALRGVLKRIKNRRRRYSISLFLLSISESMSISDTLAGNFYDLEPGSLALVHNFADPSYCEVVKGAEFGESELEEKDFDERVSETVSEAFKSAAGFDYKELALSKYVEVQTRCGQVFMGFNSNTVCVFPVNRALNYHSIQMTEVDGVKKMLKVMSFINKQKSNVLDISRDGYAHSVSLGYLVNHTPEISSFHVVKIKKKITVADANRAGSSD